MNSAEAKELIEKDGRAVVLNEDDMNTAQEIISAIRALPGVWPQIQAWMLAREIIDPEAKLYSLRDRLF